MISIIGFIFIFFCIVYLFCCSIIKKFECKNICITVLLIFCISIVLIYYDNIEEISIKDYIKIKIAKKQAYDALEIIDSLKVQMEEDANIVSELRDKLDKMFALNDDGSISVKGSLSLGTNFWGKNSGKVLTNYMTIDSSSPDGATHGMVLAQIGGYNMITASRVSDGAGGSDTPLVNVNGVLELTPQSTAPSPAKKGMIYFDSNDNKLKVYNGSNWKVVIKD